VIVSVEQIDPFSLPSVEIGNRNRLPDIPAIYFAVSKENEILYIGRAVLLQKRWKLHHRVKQLESLKDVKIAWLACNDLADRELKGLEEDCIRHFNPALNQTVIPRDLRAPGAMFNIKDLPIRTDELIGNLVESGMGTKTQIVLIAVENLWKEVKKERESKMNKQLRQALEQYLQSEDFRQGVIDSTKASWGGSSYKVEILPDGTWQNLWSNQIGNKYETPGVIIALPALNCDDLSEFTENGGTEEEYLDLGFDNERSEIEAEMRDALKSRA